MTITTNPSRDEYTSTAGQTVFNYTFKIYANTDLNVYVTPSGQSPDDSADLTTDYVVDTGTIGDEAGGFITFNTPLNNGDAVTIVSAIPYDRTVDYQNNGDFLPETVNDDNDRQVSQIKQILEQTGRTLQFQESLQGASTLSLPDPVSQNFMRWKTDLTGLENVELVDGALVVADGQLLIFPTVAALKASTSALLVPGVNVQTQGYHSAGDGGGANYLIVTPQATDEYGDHTLVNGNVVVLQFGSTINILTFGASTSNADNQPNIQAAINRFSSEGGVIEVPVGNFTILLPLVLPVNGGVTLKGVSSNESRILKSGTTPASGIPLRLIPNGGGATEDLNVDAVVICDHGDDSYHFRLVLDNIYLRPDPATTGYGVYAPRLAQSQGIQSVIVGGATAQAPFYTRDHWNSTWTRCDFQLGDFGFWVDPDTSTAGTSLTLTSCFVTTCTFGYSLKGVIYSSLIDCACDLTQVGGAAYNINNNGSTGATVNLVGCGTEQTVGRQMVVRGSTVNVIGGLFGEGDALQTLPSTFFSEGYLIEGDADVNFIGTQHTPKNFADGNFGVNDTAIFNIKNPVVRGGAFGAINFTTAPTANTVREIENEHNVLQFQQSGSTTDAMLDYYMSGTWTPAATDFTVTPRGCTYTRIGDQVTVRGRLTFSAYGGGSPGGTLVVTGLPFNYEADSLFVGACISDIAAITDSINTWTGTFSSGDQLIFTVQNGSFPAVTNSQAANQYIQFEISYKVA